jgi:hypothetical protein
MRYYDIFGYSSKMRGGAKSPPGLGIAEILRSWTGSAIGIGICGHHSSRYFEPRESTLLIGSFGGSAFLVYTAVTSFPVSW